MNTLNKKNTILVYKKFGKGVNYLHLLKGLAYFEDADKNPDIVLTDKIVKWEEIKGFFLDKIREFEDAFMRMTGWHDVKSVAFSPDGMLI